ncbi:MAG: effector-binding domain-containing protein [Granulosicoccus sp.]|jgi:effector-binding domain-containing protein
MKFNFLCSSIKTTIMKKVIIGLAGIIVIFLLINAMLPSVVKVERTRVMAAPASSIFYHINSLQNWATWSPWSKLDPSIDKGGFEGPESGVGNKHCWESEHKDVGRGCQTITESVPNEKLLSEMDFFDNGKGDGYFFLTESDGGTEVTWGFESELPFIMRVMGLMLDGMMGPVFDQGLADLEAVAQSDAPETESTYDIQVVDVQEMKYLTVTGTVHPNEIGEFLGRSYGMIGAALNGAEMAGQPSAIFHAYSDTLTQMEAAMLVSEVVQGTTEVDFRSYDAHKALKINFLGWYGDVGPAHNAMDDYMQTNGLEMAGPVREVYVTDPGAEPDTSKWLTEIYYPIQ